MRKCINIVNKQILDNQEPWSHSSLLWLCQCRVDWSHCKHTPPTTQGHSCCSWTSTRQEDLFVFYCSANSQLNHVSWWQHMYTILKVEWRSAKATLSNSIHSGDENNVFSEMISHRVTLNLKLRQRPNWGMCTNQRCAYLWADMVNSNAQTYTAIITPSHHISIS